MASHGIVHFEIPAQDVAASGQFYTDVFGWQQNADNAFHYLQLAPAERPGGAIVQAGQEMAGMPVPTIGQILMYIYSDDIDASLEQIRAHGGQVIVPQNEIPQTGWFAIFRDPAGNQMALFKPMSQD